MEKERWPLSASFCIISNVGDIPKKYLSYSENISETAETLSIEGGQESLALLDEYSGQSDIVGKDLKKHISNSSNLANIPALEYTGMEVLSKSNN